MKKFTIKFKYLLLVLFLLVCLVACDKNQNGNTDNPGQQIDPSGDNPVTNREYATVKFDTRCELSVDDVTVEKGTLLAVPKELTREGYTFEKWTWNDIQWNFDLNRVNQNITLAAVWKLNSYKLTVKYNNGDEDLVKSYSYNVMLGELTIPTKEGSKFAGWTIDGKKVSIPERMPAHDVTLEASWTVNTRTITIKYNDKVTEDLVISKDYGQKIGKLATPKRSGYAFTGWDITLPDTMPDEDLVINATWKIGTYTLTIKNYNGFSKDYVLEAKANSKLNIPDPTMNGYTFLGYYSEPGTGGIKVEFDKMYPNDFTVYANWKITEYTVTYDLDGGNVTSDLITKFDFASETFVLPIPTKKGYIFVNWICDGEVVTEINNNIKGNMDIVAKYNKIVTCLGTEDNAQKVSSVFSQQVQTPYNQPIDQTIFLVTGDYEKTDVGEYITYVTPKSGYCWTDGTQATKMISWEILPVLVNVFWSDTTVVYNGSAQVPTAIFMATESVTLPYTIKENCIDVGVYTVHLDTVEGYTLSEIKNYNIENYTVQFTIEAAELSSCELENTRIHYTGSSITPEIKSIKAGDVELTENDYTLSGDVTVTDIDTYELKVTGKGNYKGTLSIAYDVVKGSSKLEPLSDEILVYTFATSINLDTFAYNNVGATTWRIIGNDTSITARIDENNNIVLEQFDADSACVYLALSDTGDSFYEAGTVYVELTLAKIPVTVAADNLSTIKYDESIDMNGLNVEVKPLIDLDTLIISEAYFELEENSYIAQDTTYPSLFHGIRCSQGASYTYRIVVPATLTCEGMIIERQISCIPTDAIFNARIDGGLNINDLKKVVYTSDYMVDTTWYFYRKNSEDYSKIEVKEKSTVTSFTANTSKSYVTQRDVDLNLCYKYLYCTISVRSDYSNGILEENFNPVTVKTDGLLVGDSMGLEGNLYIEEDSTTIINFGKNVTNYYLITCSIGCINNFIPYYIGEDYILKLVTKSIRDSYVSDTSSISVSFKYYNYGTYRVGSFQNNVTVVPTNDITYNTYAVTAGVNGNDVYIQSYHDDNRIISLSSFKNCVVSKLYIPSSITFIYDNAFEGFVGELYFNHTAEQFLYNFDNFYDMDTTSAQTRFNNTYILNDNGEFIKANTVLSLNTNTGEITYIS